MKTHCGKHFAHSFKLLLTNTLISGEIWSISKHRFTILVCNNSSLSHVSIERAFRFPKTFLPNICIIFVVTGWNTEV